MITLLHNNFYVEAVLFSVNSYIITSLKTCHLMPAEWKIASIYRLVRLPQFMHDYTFDIKYQQVKKYLSLLRQYEQANPIAGRHSSVGIAQFEKN